MNASSGEQRALIAYDGSPSAKRAVEEAARLLRPGSALVVSVWRSLAAAAAASKLAVPGRVAREAVERHDAESATRASALAEEGAALARDAGLEAVGVERAADHNVPAAIVGMAEEEDASTIVLGSRGRSGLEYFVLGSTAAAVIQHCSRPVLLVHAEGTDARGEAGRSDGGNGAGDGSLVFAYDGSEAARTAIERSVALLAPRPAVSLTVWQSAGAGVFRHDLPEALEVARDVVDELDRGECEIAEETAAEGAELARTLGLEVEAVAKRAYEGAHRDTTTAWKELVRTAQELDAGAVVVGARRLAGLRSAVLGSVSHGVVHHCHRPVLVVPAE